MTTPAPAERSDATQRFSTRVEQYVKYRPGYPAAVLDDLRERIGFGPTWVVADVGSGTGISTQLFLDSENEVFAIEPNPEMRAAAERLLAGHARFHSIAATAEATTLPAASIDLVVAGQAFHWFDVAQTKREFQRILRPSGYVALMWNGRRTAGTPFLAAYEQLLLTYGTDYAQVRHENIDARALAAFFGPTGYATARFDNEQQFDYPSLEGRLLSSSYAPLPNQPGHAPMLQELRRIFDRTNIAGRVTVTYDTEVHVGQLAANVL